MLGVGRYGPLGRDIEDDGGGSGGQAAPGVGRPAAGERGPAPGSPRPSAIAERDAWVVLAAVPGLGPVSFGRLLATFGSAAAVLRVAAEPHAAPRLAAASADRDGGSPSLDGTAVAALIEAAGDPERVLSPARRSGIDVITLVDDAYPARLRRIELPPPVLFVRGHREALDRAHAVAVVGTRRPTAIGRSTAARIADAVAGCGATIVSGLAFGVDAAAHAATVRLGAPTVAVIGGGHERLYPASHRGLAGGDHRGRWGRRQRVRAGHLADPGHLPAPQPDHQRAVGRDGGRGGGRAQRGVDDGGVGPRTGPRPPHRARSPRRSGRRGQPRVPARSRTGGADRGGDRGAARGPGPHRATATAGEGAARGACAGTSPPAEAATARALAEGSATPDEIAMVTGLPGASVLAVLTSLEVRGLVVEAFGRYRAAGPLASAGGRTSPPRACDRGSARRDGPCRGGR